MIPDYAPCDITWFRVTDGFLAGLDTTRAAMHIRTYPAALFVAAGSGSVGYAFNLAGHLFGRILPQKGRVRESLAQAAKKSNPENNRL